MNCTAEYHVFNAFPEAELSCLCGKTTAPRRWRGWTANNKVGVRDLRKLEGLAAFLAFTAVRSVTEVSPMDGQDIREELGRGAGMCELSRVTFTDGSVAYVGLDYPDYDSDSRYIVYYVREITTALEDAPCATCWNKHQAQKSAVADERKVAP